MWLLGPSGEMGLSPDALDAPSFPTPNECLTGKDERMSWKCRLGFHKWRVFSRKMLHGDIRLIADMMVSSECVRCAAERQRIVRLRRTKE